MLAIIKNRLKKHILTLLGKAFDIFASQKISILNLPYLDSFPFLLFSPATVLFSENCTI